MGRGLGQRPITFSHSNSCVEFPRNDLGFAAAQNEARKNLPRGTLTALTIGLYCVSCLRDRGRLTNR